MFTHLDEDYQFRWLEELRRISTRGAVLLLTIDSSLAGEKDFVFQRSYEDGLFPAWYQNAFHSEKYVRENFGRYFEVLGYLPKGMNGHQDVVVLRKSYRGLQDFSGLTYTDAYMHEVHLPTSRSSSSSRASDGPS